MNKLNNTKRASNKLRRKFNRAIYHQAGGCRNLKAACGMYRLQSGMNNV